MTKTTGVRLGDVKGLILSPKMGEGDSEEHPFEFGQTIGFNQAIKLQSTRTLRLDIERTAKEIYLDKLFDGVIHVGLLNDEKCKLVAYRIAGSLNIILKEILIAGNS